MVMWEADMVEARREEGKQRQLGTEEEEEDRTRRKVLELLGKGHISKAVCLITSNGVADISDPHIRQQLESKHPPRATEIQLREAIKSYNRLNLGNHPNLPRPPPPTKLGKNLFNW